ncbi:hypothetical protein D1872_297200 [compost metagenome]
MMRPFAMLVQIVAPGAGLLVRLDQFDLQLAAIKKSQLGTTGRRLPVVFGPRDLRGVGPGPGRLFHAQKIGIGL